MKEKGETLKMFTLRVPRDWDHRCKIMADARRTTKTAIIFEAVEREWQRFTEERTRKQG